MEHRGGFIVNTVVMPPSLGRRLTYRIVLNDLRSMVSFQDIFQQPVNRMGSWSLFIK